MRLPSAQQPPRVPRSRRDARFEMGHPLPPKRGGVGIVTSREGDTATVLILEEQITGCIPLTDMPPVGAIVEVEARGDLMVILDWVSGSPSGPELGEWYFTPTESPDWTHDVSDSPVGMGERVTNPAPTGPGILWNRTDFEVHPGDALTFTASASQLVPSDVATVQLVFCWDALGSDPQPDTGDVVGYGPPAPVDTELVELSAAATVPDAFVQPGGGTDTPGRARVGLRFAPSSDELLTAVTMTRGRLLRGSEDDDFVDWPTNFPLTFINDAIGLSYLYPVDYDGHPADGTDFYPPTPAGYELTALRPYVVANTVEGQVPIVQDTSDWGDPNPVVSPWLATNSPGDLPLVIQDLPTGEPSGRIMCDAELRPPYEGFQSALTIQKADPDDPRTSVSIVVYEYGWWFVFTPAGGP